MRMNKYTLCIVLTMLIQSCTNIDVRDEAVGYYNGKGFIYTCSDNDEGEEIESYSISAKVTKDDSENIIRIKFASDNYLYIGEKIEEANNGFLFDIRPQTKGFVHIKGSNCSHIHWLEGDEDTFYHGSFDNDKNELSFAVKVPIHEWAALEFAGQEQELMEFLKETDEEGIDYVELYFELKKK